jgi:hypothetical protein
MGLWQRSLTASTWAAWQGLGGALISDPSVASTGPGSLNVAVGGIDGDAWHRTLQGGAWSGWAPLGASS